MVGKRKDETREEYLARRREYYKLNKHKWREYRKTHREEINEYWRKRRREDPERFRRKGKKWRDANPDKVRASQKKYYKNNKEKVAEYYQTHKREFTERMYASRRRHPDEARARAAVYRAIKRGDITRAGCEICGDSNSYAHHDDYNKPLDIRWLCKKHHVEWHEHNEPIRKNSEDTWLADNNLTEV